MVEIELKILEERMKKQLDSPKDAKIFSALLETLMDIRQAFDEFNKFFEIDINLHELKTFQAKKIDYSGEWCDSLIKICKVLIDLYTKIEKPKLAEKWTQKIQELEECRSSIENES